MSWKSMLPVSSRSFHSNADQVKQQLEGLRDNQQRTEEILDQMQRELVRLGDTMPDEQRHCKVHYLIAEPGFPNYGDELIAAEWLKYLAQIDPQTPVVVDCMRPGPSAAILRGLHPHLTVTDTIARLTIENPIANGRVDVDAPVADIAATIVAALEDEGRAARLASGIRLLNRDVKTMHILGGGYMNSPWAANLARLAAPQWAVAHGIPSIATGAGLVPLSDRDRQYVADVAATMIAFGCRDERSLQSIDQAGLTGIAKLMPDDCFVNALDGVYDERRGAGFDGAGVVEGKLPRTMLCVQQDFVEDHQALFQHVLAVLEAWQVDREHETLGVVECIPYECIELIKFLEGNGYRTELFPTQIIVEDGFPAAPGQRWLSTRYHPHLLASAVGAEGCYLSVKPGYYDVKHVAVLRMGSRWAETMIDVPSIPQPGSGFENPGIRFDYRDQIRKMAAVVYGW
ncbi:polysaccharide pyruvyl transferase family protein [Bifidobacterium choloepi]|uniref:Polysaccharide pyruvyl transferase family protein n=1 Tax=Bifidobacterium choloepi TaxID=2614131 RepID=A0A6I5N0M7_9BIFI|nr:polysaccharide pyruvyl transferase family protein [Bifidobacterium choloepi]NEG70478.1 polysaccharide pyruvyl transferase family protein [Bifidobacterium choloepi]